MQADMARRPSPAVDTDRRPARAPGRGHKWG